MELYNPDALTVDLKNWSLKKQTAGGKQYALVSAFASGTKIAPSGYLIIAHNNYTGSYKPADLYYTNKSNSVSEGNLVLLLNESKTIIDQKNIRPTMPTTSEVKSKTISQTKPKTNTPITIKGQVIALPGTIASQYFYVRADSKAFAVYNYKKAFPTLKLGDVITVTGQINSNQNLERLKTSSLADITIISSSSTPIPTNLSISEIDESLINNLVRATGQITEIKSNYFFLDDGQKEIIVYLKAGTKIVINEFKEGDLVTVTGIVEKAKTTAANKKLVGDWQIWPRQQSDIIIKETATSTNTTNQKNRPWLSYGLITGAGFLAILLVLYFKKKF